MGDTLSKPGSAVLSGWVAIVGLVFSGCAGYQLGTQSLYRPDIQTIRVPVFQSNSFRRSLGERLAEAVAKRIDRGTPYKVVSDAGADAVLWGRIMQDSKRPVAVNQFDEPRDIDIGFYVQIDLRDRNNNPIGQPVSLTVPTYLLTFQRSVHFVPEGGQSLTTAQQEAIDELAEQIVAQLEMPW